MTPRRKRLLASYPRSPEAASLKADLAVGTPAGPPSGPPRTRPGR